METPHDTSLIPWILSGVAAVVAALSSTIAYLFNLREGENAKAIKTLKDENILLHDKIDRCETDRAELHTQCAVLGERISIIEKKV